jgi:hypothetical protein
VATKTTTLRLDVRQAAELAAVARADEMTTSDAVREAVAKHIEERRADPDFQQRLKKLMEEDRRILEQLAG